MSLDKLKFSSAFGSNLKSLPKVSINIGACLDIPTGSLITGAKGEIIINGGLANSTGMVGRGNNYKSTIVHYMQLQGMNRMREGMHASVPIELQTYDTECNISLDRLEDLSTNMLNIPQHPITQADVWMVTDKSQLTADVWVDKMFAFMDTKSTMKEAVIEYQCFKDPYGDGCLKLPFPSFIEIDSLTEFEAKSTTDMLSSGLDDSNTNTYAMKQGGFKTKVFSQLPAKVTGSNSYLAVTAQLGKGIAIASGPMSAPEPKKLQFLKQGEEIKGATGKFNFLTLNAFVANNASKLVNQTTKKAEYPLDNKADSLETELNSVRLTVLRSKFGPSGSNIVIVVSQNEGVVPTLTEFENIKENGRFGLEGSLISYNVCIMPDVKISRTTVRTKINENKQLRRAINITSELQQLNLYMGNNPLIREVMCTPKELYDDIKALGYDWDIILRTREYWTIDQYDNKIPYLSSVDLLRMRKGLYHPYFLNEDKTLKTKYKDLLTEK